MNTQPSIPSYISTFPQPTQEILEKLRQIVLKAAPGATETISYGMPTFKLNKKNLVHFAAYEKHVGFYPTPSGIEAFKKDIEKYKHAKGSVQFQLNEPIPYDLFEKIVKYRVKEMTSK